MSDATKRTEATLLAAISSEVFNSGPSEAQPQAVGRQPSALSPRRLAELVFTLRA